MSLSMSCVLHLRRRLRLYYLKFAILPIHISFQTIVLCRYLSSSCLRLEIMMNFDVDVGFPVDLDCVILVCGVVFFVCRWMCVWVCMYIFR